MTKGLVRGLIGALDWLVPEPGAGRIEDRRRGRLLAATVLLGCAILALSGISNFFLGFDLRLGLFNFFWCGAFASLLIVLRRAGSLRLVANAIVGIGFFHLMVLSAFSGGRNIGGLFAYSVFPLVAVLLAGWRSGLVFTGLSAIAILLTPFFPVDWLAPAPQQLPPVDFALVRDALNVTAAVGLFSAIYDLARSHTLQDAERAREQAEESENRARTASDLHAHLLELAQRLLEASGGGFDDQILDAMKLTAQYAGVSRTTLRLHDGRRFIAHYTWNVSDVDEQDFLSTDVAIAQQSFPWVARVIDDGRTVQVSRLEELPREAEGLRSLLAGRGVGSWLCIPVRAKGVSAGYQAFECSSDGRKWSESEVSALGLMTAFLAAAVLRQRAEAAMRESEQKFARAFHDHPDAMVISDLENDVVIECNEQWLREVAASSREEVVGRKLWDFGFHLDDEQIESIRRLLADGGRIPGIETEITGRVGDQRTYLVSATQIELHGRPCALTSAHDLTEHKQLEQQLLHSSKLEAVGRLAGGIAHDFNNMLTVIAGYSASLVAKLEGDERRDAEEIADAARRSADLTRQLLAFSRRQVLQTQVLDPNEILRGLETMLRPLIGESITLRLDLADAPGQVRADRGQLDQAIVNLAANARDAMPSGGELVLSTRRIEVGLAAPSAGCPPELEPGAYVVISAVDDGEGMDPDLMANVVEPYFTTKSEDRGTGLGLSLVHGVARQSGGALSLESESGRGTRAQIYLPAVDEEVAPLRSAGARGGRPAAGAECTVLLVEDEPRLRRLVRRTLGEIGCRIIEASDGGEGLERARELGGELDMLVSDVVMPRLSGIELALRLRESRPDLPVLLMSGYPEPAGEGPPLPDDVEFLLKPFEPAELCAVVERGLERAVSGEG